MAEKTDRSQGSGSEPSGAGKSQRPRDAATLVIVDTTTGEPRLLMGRRRASQVFMPNKVVFPGGRVDDGDRHLPSASELADCEQAKLLLEMKGYPSALRARALAMAALRETFEETGMIIGCPIPAQADEGERTSPFSEHGVHPALGELCLFARAITPPGRTRRYDTRFFCVSAGAVTREVPAPDDELRDVSWFSIADTSGLDLPPITRVIIEDLSDRLEAGPLGPLASSIPFYHQRHGSFRRELLSIDDAS